MNIKGRKRLYRSRSKRAIFGVCGGLADYLGVDESLVRVAWLVMSIAGGPGVLLYIIMAAVVPEEPEFIQTSSEKVKNDA